MQGPKISPRPEVIQNRPFAIGPTPDDLPVRPHLVFDRVAVLIDFLQCGPDFLFITRRLTIRPEGLAFRPSVQIFQAIRERGEILIDQFEGLDVKAGLVEVFLDAEVEVLDGAEGMMN